MVGGYSQPHHNVATWTGADWLAASDGSAGMIPAAALLLLETGLEIDDNDEARADGMETETETGREYEPEAQRQTEKEGTESENERPKKKAKV